MTKEEKIVATAFTGKMFVDGSDMRLLYEYMEKKVGHGVIDLMLASKEFWEELHKACEQDFIDMVSKEQPSLPSNLDEAAEEYGRKEYSHAIHFWDEGLSKNKPEVRKEDFVYAFKAGAEWMAGQGVNLKCWIARDECSGDESNLYIGQQKPRRIPGTAPGFGMWCDYGEFMALPSDMFPELTYSDEPIEVELLIKKI